MSKKVLKYGDYQGSIEFDIDEGFIFGKVLFVKSLVMYEGQTIPELQSAFEEAVDTYIEMCKEDGLEPEKPFSGSFNVRIPADLHRKAAIEASTKGCSFNEIIKEAISTFFTIKETTDRIEEKVAEMEFKKLTVEAKKEVSFSSDKPNFVIAGFKQEASKHAH